MTGSGWTSHQDYIQCILYVLCIDKWQESNVRCIHCFASEHTPSYLLRC